MDLLLLGKTERDIGAVKGMPSGPTRYLWLADKKVSTRRLSTRRFEAQAPGVELALVSQKSAACMFTIRRSMMLPKNRLSISSRKWDSTSAGKRGY
ncbi:hypothetical protein ABIB06_007831 [Bradyrhizobium sp. LB8.2]|uniref:hypothetical protein n=1 Tax=unclassified Bradyrhizobium TaxID=2631580 RepID=UPI0033987A12